jgi:hypothetical protein
MALARARTAAGTAVTQVSILSAHYPESLIITADSRFYRATRSAERGDCFRRRNPLKKRTATKPVVSRQSLEEVAELALGFVGGGNDEDNVEGSVEARSKAVLDFIKG